MSKTKTAQQNFDTGFYQPDNLRTSWRRVRAKGSRGGLDCMSIEEYEKDLESNLQQLQQNLEQNIYVPEPSEQVNKKESGGKIRPLGMHTIQDKIVQMAVKQSVEPILNSIFLSCSYAYRPNKGHRKAINQVKHVLHQKCQWVTSCDIENFFGSLNHAVLLEQIRNYIHDFRILRLIELWLKMGVVHKGEYKNVDRGVVQGGVISPLLSNLYLHFFDLFITGLKLIIVRYADDFVILAKQQSEVVAGYDKGKEFLENKLLLKLKPVTQKAKHVNDGFVFLGICFNGINRYISLKKYEKAVAKIVNLCQKNRYHPLSILIEELNESIRSWRYYYGDVDTSQQFQQLEAVLKKQVSLIVQEKLTKEDGFTKKKAFDQLLKIQLLLNYNFSAKKRFILYNS